MLKRVEKNRGAGGSAEPGLAHALGRERGYWRVAGLNTWTKISQKPLPRTRMAPAVPKIEVADDADPLGRGRE
jgi:hypothetical protein